MREKALIFFHTLWNRPFQIHLFLPPFLSLTLADFFKFYLPVPLTHFLLSLFNQNPFYPAFNPLGISFLSPLPFHTSINALLSPFSPSLPPCSPALVLWKRALSAGLNGAGPLEARTMGPSSEGSRVHERGNKDPSAWAGPHSAPHTTAISSLYWPCMLCVVEFVYVCVCVLEKEMCVSLPV